MKMVLKNLTVEGIEASGEDIVGEQRWKGGFVEVYARSAQSDGGKTVFSYVVVEGEGFDPFEVEEIASDILKAAAA